MKPERQEGLVQKLQKTLPIPLLLLLLTGILIRCYNLSSIFLYWDEPTHSVRIAYQSLSYVLAYNNASAFFSVILHFILPLGKLELMARLPSVLFGILLIPAVFFIGRRFFSRNTGLTAAALVTFSPFFIRFSQYSRAYSMFVFFAFLSFYFLYQAAAENKKRNWIYFAVFTLPALYSHLMGFLALTGIGVYMGTTWLLSRRQEKAARQAATKTFARFIICIMIVVLTAALLYIPDMNVRGFLTASAARVKNQTSLFFLLPIVGKKIINEQFLLRAPFDSLLILFILGGLISGIISYRKKIGYLATYILIPFLLFIAIKPRGVNIQSADRYFIFILPVIFLLAAQGISFFSAVFANLIVRGRALKPRRQLITAVLLSFLAALCITGFDLGHYYLNFWRFGSYPIEKELRAYMQQNLKEDTLLYLDPAPAFGQLLTLNPLSKKIPLNHNEAAIRQGQAVPAGKHQVLIYRFEPDSIPLYENEKVDLWAALRNDARTRSILNQTLDQDPRFTMIPLTHYLILKLESGMGTLSHRFLFMLRLLQSTEPELHRAKVYSLLAARILLMNKNFPAAEKDLQQARSIGVDKLDLSKYFNPFPVRFIDRVLGFSDRELFSLYYDLFHHRSLARQLYNTGVELHSNKRFDQAYAAFKQSLNFSEEFNRQISRRFFLLGNNHLSAGNFDRAIPLYEKAVRLDPDRFALRFFLAEAHKLRGNTAAAEKIFRELYKKTVPGLVPLPKIMNQDPVILVSRTASGWRIIFRAQNNINFAGTINADKILDEVTKIRFNNNDSLIISAKQIRLNFKMDKRRLKILEIKTRANKELMLDIEINGRLEKGKIIFTN